MKLDRDCVILYVKVDLKTQLQILYEVWEDLLVLATVGNTEVLSHNWKVFGICWSTNIETILIYIQQDATLHSLFYLETALHVSGVTTTHHQERKQLYL